MLDFFWLLKGVVPECTSVKTSCFGVSNNDLPDISSRLFPIRPILLYSCTFFYSWGWGTSVKTNCFEVSRDWKERFIKYIVSTFSNKTNCWSNHWQLMTFIMKIKMRFFIIFFVLRGKTTINVCFFFFHLFLREMYCFPLMIGKCLIQKSTQKSFFLINMCLHFPFAWDFGLKQASQASV